MSAVTVCSDFGSQENRGFLFLQNKPRLLPWPSWLCVIEPLAVSQASSPSNLLALVLLYPYFSFNSPNRHSSPPLSLWTRCPLPWWASDGLLLSIQSWTKHGPPIWDGSLHAPPYSYSPPLFSLLSFTALPSDVMWCPQPLPGGCPSMRLVGESVWFLCISFTLPLCWHLISI